jgi:hypothetical protein
VLAPGDQVADQQAHRLCGIAAALIPGSDREAYLALAGVIGPHHGGTVADQLPGRAQRHGELEPFPWRIGVGSHHLPVKRSPSPGG